MQVLDNGRRLHLGDAADATKSALSRFSNGVTAALRTPLTAIQNAFGGPAAAVSSVAFSPHTASTTAVSEDAQDQALGQDSRSADFAQSQLQGQDSHSAGVSDVAQGQTTGQDSHSAGDSDSAQGADLGQDSHFVEASPPGADALPAALPAGAPIREPMRAPSDAHTDASPMEERLAGQHTTHAGQSRV